MNAPELLAIEAEDTHKISRKSVRGARIELITRGERRRRWSIEQKQEIAAESLQPNTTPTEGLKDGEYLPLRNVADVSPGPAIVEARCQVAPCAIPRCNASCRRNKGRPHEPHRSPPRSAANATAVRRGCEPAAR